MKQTVKIWILSVLMFVTGALDIYSTEVTEAIKPGFEANPLYVLSGSFFVVYAVKIGIIVLVTWLLFSLRKPKTQNIFRFCMVLVACYMILIQALAGISNFRTADHLEAHPDTPIPTGAEKSSQYLMLGALLYYVPVAMALLGFWVFERLYQPYKVE